MIDTLIGVVQGIKEAVVETITNIVCNPESITILSLAAVGTTCLISKVPYAIVVPLWVEGLIAVPFIIPVISVMFIAGLVMTMKYRLCLYA